MKKIRGVTIIVLFCLVAGFFCCQNIQAENLININTATVEEFDTLPGIGAVKAQAIVDYREVNGFFQTKEEIMNVSGIGLVTFENIKDSITINEDEEEDEEPEENEVYCGNNNIDEGEECDDGNNIDGDGCSKDCFIENNNATTTEAEVSDGDNNSTTTEEEIIEPQSENTVKQEYKMADLIINEIVSDPADNEVEWVELFNNTKKIINLEDWKIIEGSGKETILTGSVGIGNNRFFVVEKPKGNLNNSGDLVILKFKNSIIDKVAYGKWDDGTPDNNAPVAKDPYSIARKIDGYSSYDNFFDFAITSTVTKGESNIIIDPKALENGEGIDKSNYDHSDDIYISEIFPDPAGSDREAEFIELYNNGERNIKLNGWRLVDASEKIYEFAFEEEIIIKSKDFSVIDRETSAIALNNSKDCVYLFAPFSQSTKHEVCYTNAPEGESYNLIDIDNPNRSSSWAWLKAVTPAAKISAEEEYKKQNIDFDCPEEGIRGRPVLFDSSDTIDSGENKFYYWEFGDNATNTLRNPEHTFFQTGIFTVQLTVGDGISTSVKEKIITIKEKEILNSLSQKDSTASIVINEIIPNPVGTDLENEWIELYNSGGAKVNLLNWQIDDGEGGSKPYYFNESIWFESGEYMVISREESGIALNNTADMVRLINGNNDTVDETKYKGSYEGESYAKGENDKWYWTTMPTPDENNIIKVSESKTVKNNLASGQVSGSEKLNKKIEKHKVLSFEQLREAKIGDRIEIIGKVIVEPGILGSQFFYIASSSGIQVYNYKKDFPKMNEGDLVKIKGELSEVNGEKRLKTKIKADIAVLSQSELKLPDYIKCEDVTENIVGTLVAVNGELVERKGSLLYLDDGSEEAMVYIKKTTGLVASSYNKGEMLEITGVAGKTASGIRIMPRKVSDIKRKDVESSEVGKVLGEVAINDEWELAARNKKIELMQYLLVIAGGLILLLSGLLVKVQLKK